MIRKAIFAIGVITILVGASQVVQSSWWLDRLPDLVYTWWLYVLGVVAVVFGVLLLAGAAFRLVGLRAALSVIGLIALVWGLLALAIPNLVRDVADALVLNRARGIKLVMFCMGGAIRIGIGAMILYALWRAPRPETPAEPVPPAGGQGPAPNL